MLKYSQHLLIIDQHVIRKIIKRFLLKCVEPVFVGTMVEVKQKYFQSMGVGIGYVPLETIKRDHLLKYVVSTREDLPPRSIKDSYVKAIIPLNTDKCMQVAYVNNKGLVRLGRLMEEMDFFAALVAQTYVKLPNLPPDEIFPYSLVTILVDNMKVHQQPTYDSDIYLLGYVSWVGKSSMEVTIELLFQRDNCTHTITQAHFIMAARTPTNTGPAFLNPLIAENEEEQQIIDVAEERIKRRKDRQSHSVYAKKPTHEEYDILYDFYSKTTIKNSNNINQRVLPPKSAWMADSSASNTILSFPQNRNANNTVFGGFIMRSNMELTAVAAIRYAQQRPVCKYISEFTFKTPVPIDSIVDILSHVIYTRDKYILLMTVNNIMSHETGQLVTSNTSYVLFESHNRMRQIYPGTYEEAMWYLQGRRIFNEVAGTLEQIPTDEC